MSRDEGRDVPEKGFVRRISNSLDGGGATARGIVAVLNGLELKGVRFVLSGDPVCVNLQVQNVLQHWIHTNIADVTSCSVMRS